MDGPGTYDTDFVRWTEEQAAAIRAAAASRTNLPIDWENVAEEIEDLGRSIRRELGARLQTIVEHLLKLELSPAREPRQGWIETIVRSRQEIEDLLEESPSLRPALADLVATETPKAARLLGRLLQLRGEATPAIVARLKVAGFTTEQVTGDWFPPEVAAAAETS
jgi:hypothetical protein